MRAFVVVFLLSAVCVCAGAQEEKPADPQNGQTVTAEPAQTFVIGSPDSIVQQNQRVFSGPEWLPGLSLKVEKPRTFVIPYNQFAYFMGGAQCYKMRSYIVKRESNDSDVTTPAGYTECTPARRVKMKNAVPENEPDTTEQR